jgi:type IV pilus secretin PilQ/predicted competence protein
LQDAGAALQRIETVLDTSPSKTLIKVETAADARHAGEILAAFDREFGAAVNALHDLYASIDAHVARIDNLAAQLPQPAVAVSQANPLDALDRSMASLRSDARPSATQRQTPLDELSAALERVRAESPSFALAPPAQFAALMNDDEEQPSAPPAARSAVQEAATSTSAGFQRVEEIRASDAVVRAAEATGAIVLAQAGQDPEEPVDAEVISDAEMDDLPEPASRVTLSTAAAAQPPAHLYNPNVPASQDPLRQPVNIDFQEMDLSTVVGLLARKAQINVIADEKVEGSVTANLQGIPLGRAIEVVLRMNNLGIVEEDGVYRITSWEEAIAARRDTRMIPLENAQAADVAKNIVDLLANSPDQMLLSVSASPSTNHLILTGPIELIRDYEVMAKTLDIAPQVVPTITKAVKLNYSSPEELLPIISTLVGDTGRVSGDVRGRHLVVTDIPVKVEEITKLIEELDVAVRQVNISAMIVDAVLSDDARTGIDWTLNAIRRTDRDGNVVSNLAALGTENDFTTGPITPGAVPGINLGSQIMFGILSGDFDIRAAIAGEVASNNGELLANPTIVTLENKPARISISEEVPYQELTQSLTGPPIATTEFKEIGTTLQVTTRVTHDDHVIVDLSAKQSDTKGESVTGVPIEDKREADTSLRVRNGQTIFIGGLRRFDDELSVRKTPILGDIPVLNFLFRNQTVVKDNVELLIFLTCNIMPEMVPELTPAQKDKFDKLGGVGEEDINATRDLVRNYLHPDDQRDPIYKWRRTK